MRIFDRFRKRVSPTSSRLGALPTTPATIADLPPYPAAFRQALGFTKSLGFAVPNIEIKDAALPCPDIKAKIHRAMALAKVDDITGSAGSCLRWNHYLEGYFTTAFGAPVLMAIGQVWYKDKPVYSPTWEDVARWVKYGIQPQDFVDRSGINLHAWLTAPSGEIIDLSLCSTLARVIPENFGDLLGLLVAGFDGHVFNNHRYYPMLLGAPAVEAIASRSFLALLANNRDDLEKVSSALLFQPN